MAGKWAAKPELFDAFRLGFDPWPPWFSEAVARHAECAANGLPTAGLQVAQVLYAQDGSGRVDGARVQSRSGWLQCRRGDWLVVDERARELRAVIDDASFHNFYVKRSWSYE